jgi:hypothetical protein
MVQNVMEIDELDFQQWFLNQSALTDELLKFTSAWADLHMRVARARAVIPEGSCTT